MTLWLHCKVFPNHLELEWLAVKWKIFKTQQAYVFWLSFDLIRQKYQKMFFFSNSISSPWKLPSRANLALIFVNFHICSQLELIIWIWTIILFIILYVLCVCVCVCVCVYVDPPWRLHLSGTAGTTREQMNDVVLKTLDSSVSSLHLYFGMQNLTFQVATLSFSYTSSFISVSENAIFQLQRQKIQPPATGEKTKWYKTFRKKDKLI